jgi:hypothetical protein
MTLRTPLALLTALAGATTLPAQSLGQRVRESDGIVQIVYPSRPNACGDGQSFIGNVFGSDRFYSGDVNWTGRNPWQARQCVHGPARVNATVVSGEVTRIRAYVGPVPNTAPDMRTLTVSANEAAAWMSDLITRGTSRVASDAILPLVLADGPEPWPLLLKVARDDNRPRDVRRNAMTWLSSGVSEHLGLSNADDGTSDDDEMRKQAVYVLSQRPKSESVPGLIELSRSAKHASARKMAIYWLGQTGDSRAVEVYAELLGIR